MAITNYGELKEAVKDFLKRDDCDAAIPEFCQAVHVKLVEAVGNLAPLSSDTDTNQLLDYDPMVYIYGALAEAFIYARDLEMATVYTGKFLKELQNLYATGFDTISGSPNGPVV